MTDEIHGDNPPIDHEDVGEPEEAEETVIAEEITEESDGDGQDEDGGEE